MAETEKPHMVLHWVLDVPKKELKCVVNEDLTYIAIDGGHGGLTKIYKGVTTHLTQNDWVPYEKMWLSEEYGDQVGYFQPSSDRIVIHPTGGYPQQCINGVGPDGQYLDHLQRMQILMEGKDQVQVWPNTWPRPAGPHPLFSTPDRGLTIYKRTPAQGVRYPEAEENPDMWWYDHPQPCAQQPYSKGYQLSSYEELAAVGCSQYAIDKCKAGRWEAPEHPELQAYYILPKTIDENPV